MTTIKVIRKSDNKVIKTVHCFNKKQEGQAMDAIFIIYKPELHVLNFIQWGS